MKIPEDPKHPIYPLLRFTVALVSLTVILAVSASNFDITEIRTIIAMFIVLAGGEGLIGFFQRMKNGKD